MTYVVTENCIRCKYMDCVEVCPVDCFYVGENMLMIHPDECIDCGVCEPAAPASRPHQSILTRSCKRDMFVTNAGMFVLNTPWSIPNCHGC